MYCRPLLWLTNDVINGADKHALSSLLLRLSQLGCNVKSCLLSRRKKPFIWRQKTAVRFPSVLGKTRGFGFGFKNRNSPNTMHTVFAVWFPSWLYTVDILSRDDATELGEKIKLNGFLLCFGTAHEWICWVLICPGCYALYQLWLFLAVCVLCSL